MEYVLGVDVGSSSTKAVAVDLAGNILSRQVERLGTGAVDLGAVLGRLHHDAGLDSKECVYFLATGYGRMTIKEADNQMSEISCHVKGVTNLLPHVRTIIDIGGQDCKAIALDEKGVLKQFAMNDKCAAGTGRFLDTMSRVLNLSIEDLGVLDARSDNPIPISSTCTVFAESEVVSALSQEGVRKEDIVAGIHESVARKVAGLVRRVGLVEPVCLTGGGALDCGVQRWLEKELNVSIAAAPDPQMTGALGAALMALKKYNEQQNNPRLLPMRKTHSTI